MSKIKQVFIPSEKYFIQKEGEKGNHLIAQIFLLDDNSIKLLTDEATIVALVEMPKK